MMELHEGTQGNKDLYLKLWDLANELRAELDSTSYKEHILQFLFLKHISSKADDAINLDVKLFEPRKSRNSFAHRLTYHQFINGGMSNDNK